jgi:hypothetical protein
MIGLAVKCLVVCCVFNAFSPGSACRLCDETSIALSCGVTSALEAGRYESANHQCATETGEQQRTKHFALARHY